MPPRDIRPTLPSTRRRMRTTGCPAGLRGHRSITKGRALQHPRLRTARPWRGAPRLPTARASSTGGLRSYQLADDRVDLRAYAGRCARWVAVEEDRAAHRDEARGRIAVPCRTHRGRDVATLRANPRNEKWKLRSLAHIDDRRRCRRTDDQANVAVAIGSLGHVRDAQEQRSAVGIEMLQVLGARVRAAAHDVHAAVFVSSELLQRVHAEVGAP